MSTDQISADVLRQLHATPETVLCGRHVDDIGTWDTAILAPRDITPEYCPLYTRDWGAADDRGLSHQVRAYITSARIADLVASRPSLDWDALARELTSAACSAMDAFGRGDDALADEILGDPTAWTSYVI